jgi:hypothetical protein
MVTGASRAVYEARYVMRGVQHLSEGEASRRNGALLEKIPKNKSGGPVLTRVRPTVVLQY